MGSWFGGGSSLCAPQGQPCKLQDLYYNQLHGIITQPCAGPAWPPGLLQSVLDFQRNKQARLNALPSIVRLRLHQVEHVQDDGLGAAQELGASRIVFSRGQLQRLKARAQVGGLLCIMCVFFNVSCMHTSVPSTSVLRNDVVKQALLTAVVGTTDALRGAGAGQ